MSWSSASCSDAALILTTFCPYYFATSDIVNSGAIGSFISIATEHDGKLRAMAIEAMRVLSEDTSSKRRTRIQLCEEGAANSLGRTLLDDVKELHDVIKFSSRGKNNDVLQSLSELHDALCTLANILEPIQPGKSTTTKLLFVPTNSDPSQHLIKGCIQIVESGGLDSLLWISSIPLATQPVWGSPESEAQLVDLLEEASRSLASLFPLLLSKEPAMKGYSSCAIRVFEDRKSVV